MKNLYFLFLIVTGIMKAQIISFPDANFKAKILESATNNGIAYSNGASIKVDANNDGNIQFIEAQVIDSLAISGINIQNVIGINGFNNLKKVELYNTRVSVLDLSGLSQLKRVACIENSLLQTVDLSGLSNLTWAFFYSDLNITSINVSGCVNLRRLDFARNKLASINLSDCVNLRYLICDNNELTELDVSNLASLETLSCSYNRINTLDVTHCPLLFYLDVSQNPMVSLFCAGLTKLYSFIATSSSLESLDFSGCSNLNLVKAAFNSINEISVSGCTNLQTLELEYNQFSTIDITDCPKVHATVYFNSNLKSVFMKNGNSNNNYLGILENPNLQYICADEGEIATLASRLTEIGLHNTVINSYCFYSNGGDQNRINATVVMDADSDGCDANDINQSNQSLIKMTIEDFATQGATFHNADGNYVFYTGVGNFTLTPHIEHASLFTISPPTAVVSFTDFNNIASPVFCITPNGVHHDVEIMIVPFPARPGFDAHYEVIYKNNGNQSSSGTIRLDFDDSVLDYVSSVPVLDNQGIGIMNWNYTNLEPFETRVIDVVMNLNSPQEDPAVNIGHALNFAATMTTSNLDETPENNTSIVNQFVVGAFDPNDKTCLEGETITPEKIGEYLHYLINFENTGNFPAERIVVKDIIDTNKFEMSSLQLVSASHPVLVKIGSDKAEFFFENINLGANEHGNVIFKIKTKNTLVTGDSVSNKANIYFDYNFPIETNLATSVFQVLANEHFLTDDSVRIYPNPANEYITIKAAEPIKSIQLIDMQGRIMKSIVVVDTQSEINLFDLSKGIYFVKVITNKGIKTEKLIRK